MVEGSGEIAAPSQAFSDEGVMEARYRLEAVKDAGAPARNLYLRTYKLVDAETRTWQAAPENEWPLLASITSNQIIMWPVHVNPHAQRYLSPKNGRFTKVIYVDGAYARLPNDCSGQLIPDTVLNFSSATAGVSPPLKV